MADNSRTIKSVLAWEVDKSSLTSATNAWKTLATQGINDTKRIADAAKGARANTEAWNSVIGKLGATSSASLTILEQKMRDGERSTARLRQEVDATGKEYEELTVRANSAAAATSRAASAGGGGGSALATARSAAGAAGGALSTIGGGQAASAVSSVLGLTATLGPLGAVAGIVTVGIGALNSEMKKNEEAYVSRINTEQEVAKSIRNATTAQIEALRAAAVDQLQFDQEVARQRQLAFAQYNLEIASYPLLFGPALAGLDSNYNALKTTMEQAGQAVRNSQITVDAYNVALEDNAGLVGDFVVDFKRGFADGFNQVGRGITSFFDELQAANERRASAISSQSDAYLKFLDIEADARTTLAELATKTTEITSEHDAKALELQQEVAAKRVENATATGDRIEEIEADAGRERAKTVRNSALSLKNATAYRDALAYTLEKQRTTQQLEDQAEGAKVAADKQKDADAKQNQQLEAQLAKQLKANDDAATKQLSAQKKTEDTALTQLKNAQVQQTRIMTDEQQFRQIREVNHQNSMSAIAGAGNAAVIGIANSMWNAIIAGAQQAYRAVNVSGGAGGGGNAGGGTQPIGAAYQAVLAQQQQADREREVARAYAQYYARTGVGFGAGQGIPRYATGTPYVPKDGLAFLHRGEAVIPQNKNQGSGLTINVPIVGTQMTKQQVMAYAADEIGISLDAAGW